MMKIRTSCPHCDSTLEVEFKLRDLTPKAKTNWRHMTLQDMELSIRSYNCLHNDGLETAGEIDAKTDRELLCLANFGRRSLWEVREVIKYLKGEYNEFDEKVAAK